MKPVPEQIKEIRGLVNGYKASQIIISAEEVGVFNELTDMPRHVDIIAKNLNIKTKFLTPLLNSLAGLGLINKEEENYSISSSFNTLAPDNPSSQIGYLRFAKLMKDNWSDLTKAIKDENRAATNFGAITGSNTEATKSFIDAMHANAKPQASFIANNYNFSNHRILDIGAGAGTYCIEIGKKYQDATGILIDLPSVASFTQEYITKNAINNRFDVIGDNYHDYSTDEKFDDIFLFAIIHQESDKEALNLLKKMQMLLKPEGRLFLSSFFLEPSQTAPLFSVLFSIEMLVMTPNGKVYTHVEVQNLHKSAGFNKIERVEIPGPATLYVSRIN